MSIPRDYPFIRVGDRLAQLQAWRLWANDPARTLDDLNTDRGRLFVEVRSAFPVYPIPAPVPAGATAISAAESSLDVSVVQADILPLGASVAPADDVTPVLVTATIRDAAGNPLAGRPVRFTSSGSGFTFDPPEPTQSPLGVAGLGITDADGIARVSIYSNTVGLVGITAHADCYTIPVTVTQTASISFTAATAPSGVAVVVLYKDRDRRLPVAAGRQAAGARLDLQERQGSKITGSVWLNDATTGAVIQLYVSLASANDFRRREDRMDELKLESPEEISDFEDIQRTILREFYLKIFSIYPAQGTMGNPLSFAPDAEIQQAGYFGQVDPTTLRLWTINVEGDYELTGLQNPGDFREWAVAMFQRYGWERRIRGGDIDSSAQRVNALIKQADGLFQRTRPIVDVDRNGVGDRIAEKSTIRFRRG